MGIDGYRWEFMDSDGNSLINIAIQNWSWKYKDRDGEKNIDGNTRYRWEYKIRDGNTRLEKGMRRYILEY